LGMSEYTALPRTTSIYSIPSTAGAYMSAVSALLLALAALVWLVPGVSSQTVKTPGVSEKEIKIGQTMPYSGRLSAYATIGKAELAFFKMINDQGGINGRKINLISVDDGYNPAKTVEQVRKLVEQDVVALIFQTLGGAPNTVIQKYLNDRHIPQLFVADGSSKWDHPQHFPWTMPWQPSYRAEAHIDVAYLLKHKPNAKIGVLYQNDALGKDYIQGIREALGDKAKSMIVSEISYEAADPTIDSQIVSISSSGADTFFD